MGDGISTTTAFSYDNLYLNNINQTGGLTKYIEYVKNMCLVLFEITKVRFSNIREPEESPYIQKR
jgi:hypothetical protein